MKINYNKISSTTQREGYKNKTDEGNLRKGISQESSFHPWFMTTSTSLGRQSPMRTTESVNREMTDQ